MTYIANDWTIKGEQIIINGYNLDLRVIKHWCDNYQSASHHPKRRVAKITSCFNELKKNLESDELKHKFLLSLSAITAKELYHIPDIVFVKSYSDWRFYRAKHSNKVIWTDWTAKPKWEWDILYPDNCDNYNWIGNSDT